MYVKCNAVVTAVMSVHSGEFVSESWPKVDFRNFVSLAKCSFSKRIGYVTNNLLTTFFFLRTALKYFESLQLSHSIALRNSIKINLESLKQIVLNQENYSEGAFRHEISYIKSELKYR